MCERHGNVIICGRRGGKSLGKCQECFVREATLLCDGPRRPGVPADRKIAGSDKTCSKPLCASCTTRPLQNGPDYCREHRAPESRRLAL